MVTLVFALILIGFLCFYTTSQKMKLSQWPKMQKWCHKHILTTKILGSFALIISCSLAIVAFGLGAGILTFIVFLMMFASLIILLGPLQFLSYKTLISIALLSLISELFLF